MFTVANVRPSMFQESFTITVLVCATVVTASCHLVILKHVMQMLVILCSWVEI